MLSISRSAYYYKSTGETEYNDYLMRVIDEEYTRHPFYGSRRITACLKRQGYDVNRKRITRLMRYMGIEAIYPKPHLSQSLKEHKKYPYLLKGLNIDHPNHVWSADITYIRLQSGFVYLVAIIDWYSRYVLSSEVSTTLEKDFCISSLEEALQKSKPEIFNTDQGVQFTNDSFISRLHSNNISISMDGRGRALDNIFVERLWRSVKYEEVYINDYKTVRDAANSLSSYFEFYNNERPHQALDYQTPFEVYTMN